MDRRMIVLLLLITFFLNLILSALFAKLGSNWMKKRLETLEFKVKHLEESRLKNIEDQIAFLSKAALESPRQGAGKVRSVN